MDKYYTIKKVNESENKTQKLEWIVALLVLTAIPCSIIVASIIIALKFSNPFKFLLTWTTALKTTQEFFWYFFLYHGR